MQYGAFLLTRPLSYFLTANLTLKQLSSGLMGIEHRWFELGIHLEVPFSMLKSIEADCFHDSHRCLLELLEYWLNNDPAASWTKLVGVLRGMSENLLAHRIYTAYMQGTASHERLIFSCSTKSTP